jgi:hypothetical protein
MLLYRFIAIIVIINEFIGMIAKSRELSAFIHQSLLSLWQRNDFSVKW